MYIHCPQLPLNSAMRISAVLIWSTNLEKKSFLNYKVLTGSTVPDEKGCVCYNN